MEGGARSRSAKREIQNSSKVTSVSNSVFVGEGVEKNVAAWTHLKGVEWGACDVKSEVWTVSPHAAA